MCFAMYMRFCLSLWLIAWVPFAYASEPAGTLEGDTGDLRVVKQEDALVLDDPVVERAPAAIAPLFGGRYLNLGDLYYEGAKRPRRPRSVVVLNFMSLDCPPCRRAMPVFVRVVRAMQQEAANVQAFAVSLDRWAAHEALRGYLVGHELDLEQEVLLDPYLRTAGLFGVTGIPRVFVISPQGRIMADILGFPETYEEALRDGIRNALEPMQTE